VGGLAESVQEATGELVELAYLDQGYTGERPATEAETHGMRLEVVKHEEAKRGFVLLPRRWVVERNFAWASRFRRLAKDCERLPMIVPLPQDNYVHGFQLPKRSRHSNRSPNTTYVSAQ
jgi:transposase